MSKCWEHKYGYELFSFTESNKQIGKCLSAITDFSSSTEALGNNLRILVFKSLNTEALKAHNSFKEVGLDIKNRGNNYKFYNKVGVPDELTGKNSNMYKLRQSNNHYTPDATTLKVSETEAEVAKNMIKDNIKILCHTHFYLRCGCVRFKNTASNFLMVPTRELS